ncbi:MAG: radical SAM family heme chaperone HemW [Paludibacteraceae bacterium]|nr:radical SAM family heme chaperone HemW [Paludibacteraceae bacterium]
MAGLYIHIPFCRKRCLYCDFFSTTQLHRRTAYVDALLQEIIRRKDETGEPIRTVYIGGGTPSQLDTIDIFRILRTVGLEYAEEVTMEVNPADVTPKYLQEVRQCGVNRLSIGVQSFKDTLLQTIGRRHNGIQALNAVHIAQDAGFDNISIDLMYALPGQTKILWASDVELALRLGVQHISSYGLMYEEGTQLTQMRDKGSITPVDEDTENEMYDTLCKRLKESGFVHYEVSNFALPGYEAKHNSSYWNHTPYIGIGAGAHSLVGNVRSWNPDNLEKYIRGVYKHTLRRKSETLSETDLYNERIMLGLRTNRGVAESEITHGHAELAQLEQDQLITRTDGRVTATQQGLHVLNRIIEKLMKDDE